MNAAPTELAVERFRDAVGSVLGLRVEDARLEGLAALLARRLQATGRRLDGYLDQLAADEAEQAQLVADLAVHETYLMRNPAQLAALEVILRARVAAGARTLRLLSAGCASGEEAYSLAIVARRAVGDHACDIDIVGWDASPLCIERARVGSYSAWSLRATDDDLKATCFTARRGGRFDIDPSLKRLVRFERRNLVAPDREGWGDGDLDVVFCRNVLMYLTAQGAAALLDRIERALAPDGYLFVGHAETLHGRSRAFRLAGGHGAFYYRRAAHAAVAEPRPIATAPTSAPLLDLAATPSWSEAIARSASRVAALARPEERRRSREAPRSVAPPQRRAELYELITAERFQDALDLLGPAPTDPEERLARAVLLVAVGDVEAASAAAAEVIARDDLEADAHYVLALCHEHTGETDAALDHLRGAGFLDPDFAMPHVHRGLAARRRGDVAVAQRELSLAVTLLADEQERRLRLFGGGFGRDALIGLCRAELANCGEGAG